MPLAVPFRPGAVGLMTSSATTSSNGTTLTCNATPHNVGAWAQIIASTSADAFGILVEFENTAVSNANTSMLVNIGRGAAASEVTIIPNLAAGYQLPRATGNAYRSYFFPLFIPSGTRISGQAQGVVVSDTVVCKVTLLHTPRLGFWTGTRVTAYGANTAASGGVTCSAGNNVYGTAGTISASTTNPIKYMQLGVQGATRTGLADLNLQAEVRLGASSVIAGPLHGASDTGTESVDFNRGRWQLSQYQFDLPAAVDLRVALMQNATAADFDVIVYGVD